MGFNRNLLIQMQQATPTTLGLAGTLTALLCYGWHLRVGAEGRDGSGDGGARRSWAILGGLALGLALMSVGGFGLIGLPVVLLHQAYLRAGSPPGERSGRWWLAWRGNPSLAAGRVGPGDRAGAGGPLARPDVRRLRARTPRRPCWPRSTRRAATGRASWPAGRPGPRHPAAGALRRRPDDPPGPDRRERRPPGRRRGVLGALAGRGRAGARALAERAPRRARPVPARPA